MVELLPFLVLTLVLVSLTFGLWSSIHAGTLGSIAARHNAFAVINNRANFDCHRDTMKCENSKVYYKPMGYRFFAIVNKAQPDPTKPEQIVRKRSINLFKGFDDTFKAKTRHPLPRYIQLKQGYGICIDCNCGDRLVAC